MVGAPRTSAADQASFNGASSAVQNAFVAVQTAGNDGGNITALVTQLNGALTLLQNANTENASNPSQASTDLQSAVSIAQGVQASAASVAQQGISARQFQLGLSIGSAIVIVGLAAALYLYGDRVYRRLWLWMFGGQIVKKIG
jgi:predicted PurR-regulated permease PerM